MLDMKIFWKSGDYSSYKSGFICLYYYYNNIINFQKDETYAVYISYRKYIVVRYQKSI